MFKCKKCGSENITVERRPNGNCTCQNCGNVWQNGKEQELSTTKKLLWLVKNCIEFRSLLTMMKAEVSMFMGELNRLSMVSRLLITKQLITKH